MFRLPIALLLTTLLILPVSAQNPSIRYEVGWGAPNEHWFDVTLHVEAHAGNRLEVRMPYWRPGTYVVQNYARNIIGVSAATVGGTALPIAKTDRNTWYIGTQGISEVVVTYRQWANQHDAGASYVGQGRASLNPISTLMNVRGREFEQTAISFDKPANWKVATALDYDESINAWRAEDYHELIDSPFLISPDQVTHTFEIRGAVVELVVLGEWTYDADRLIDHHRRFMEAQFDLMDDVPFERYVFLYQFLPYRSGHGVEHKNSTSIVLGPGSMVAMPDDMTNLGFYRYVLGVASHEFFHAWNIERIRPAAMQPTDYSREQYTSQMWIYEGITDYYGDQALLRGGLISDDVFLAGMAETIQGFDQNPGRRVTSIAMSSFDSWAKQADSPPHTFYSFYPAGKAMGFALDLEIRGRTQNRHSLDDVMRLMNDQYGKTGIGVPEDGFQLALEQVAGYSFDTFFDAHIHGTEDVDWESYLSHAGLTLTKRPDTRRTVSLGVELDGSRITSVLPESAAHRAGLDTEDVITGINGKPVDGPVAGAFAENAPGDEVSVTVDRWGTSRTVLVTMDPSNPNYRFSPVESPTQLQQEIRADWLRSND